MTRGGKDVAGSSPAPTPWVNQEDEEHLVAALAAAAPIGAALLDRELRYRWVNQALTEMNGRSAAAHIGRMPTQVLGVLGAELEQVIAAVVVDDRPLVNYRFAGDRSRGGGGSGFWMGSYYPLHDETGQVVAVGALINDVTEQESATIREREFLAALVRVAHAVATEATSRGVYAVVAEEAARALDLEGAVVTRFRPDGIMLLGSWGAVGEFANQLEAVVPSSVTPLTELVRDTGQAQRLAGDQPDVFGFRTRIAAPIRVDGELWGALKAGSQSSDALSADAEERLDRFAELVGLAVGNAIEHRRLLDQATTDPLTGLCNRHAFQARMDTELQRARRHATTFSLALLDLDNFKHINDAYGHDVGDAVLTEMSRRLQREARAEDLLARIGGEEFAWIMPEINSRSAATAAERARQSIAGAPFPRVGHVTVSAGVCDLTEAADHDTLYRLADKALYYAKASSRNICARYSNGTIALCTQAD